MTKVNAEPDKRFFIEMLTKDISLLDCIMDFIDNSVDAANDQIARHSERSYNDFEVRLTISKNSFVIVDNCGGMNLETAKSAFRMGGGSHPNSKAEKRIGLYGIGMKRAAFKIGKRIEINSSTEHDAFSMLIDVNEWAKNDTWEFNLSEGQPHEPYGLRIEVADVYSQVGEKFETKSFFEELLEAISRDYMIVLRKGMGIVVNDYKVPPKEFFLLNGDNFNAEHSEHTIPVGDTTVKLEIIAGIWAAPEPEEEEEYNLTTIDPGWYVVCNDRVVLAGDKTQKTGWGTRNYIKQKWHSQYKPFIGFAMFSSDTPEILPWSTTKRDVDLESAIYRQARLVMAEATQAAIEYTNHRKADKENAENLERRSQVRSIFDVPQVSSISFPKVGEIRVQLTTISYQVPLSQLKKVKSSLGEELSNREIGELTFRYYLEMEAQD